MKRTLAFLALLLLPAVALAQPVVFVVRHAERADAGMAAATKDPDLSEIGRARAQSLAALLKDARVTGIYVSEFKRTRQTAEPLAALNKIEPVVLGEKDLAQLAARLKAGGNVLIVGHSNTVPAILKALGVTEPVTIGDAEFDNLFVVTGGAAPSLVRLRYR
jgi:broad specificity phosphatase PhoE